MPHREFDPDDPMEVVGVRFPGDCSEAMAQVFVEEFAMLGYSEEELLGIFRDPHYRLPHAVWRSRGESFVRHLIRRVAENWAPPEEESHA